MKKRTIKVVSLGCSKNLVDSERVIAMLRDAGFDAEHSEGGMQTGNPDIVVVNTCGFIGDAKEESIDEIMTQIAAKTRGDIRELYVMGCLSERYRAELAAELPEVDRFYGKYDWAGLASDLARVHPGAAAYDRVLATGPHHAYIKIAEGCNRFCAFCAIPLITGRLHSRPIPEIVEEVRMLVGRGIKEFNIIAQDLSDYGVDLEEGKRLLPKLIEAIADVEGVEWIRLHYAYPASFPMEVLDVMASRHNVCKYLDIALQHSSDRILDRMHRNISAAETDKLLAEMRRRVPDIHLRTTLMVGFPGETEEDFENLMEFTRRHRFERMGAFAYCEEEDTFAARNYADDVPADVKQRRLDRLMALQEEISQEIQSEKIGKILRVVVDREEDDFYVGRTQWDSPEVDPEVMIEKTRKLVPGEFIDIRILQALPFELIGRESIQTE